MTQTFKVRGYDCIVDDEDAHWLQGRKAFIARMRSNCPTAPGHVWLRINGRRMYLHRLIMDCPKGMVVDHRDGDTLNNRRANLRICTLSQNAMNRGANWNNPVGLKGVRQDKRARLPTWLAKIKVNGADKHLGSFRTPEEAHAAYCAAAPKYHGEFARTA